MLISYSVPLIEGFLLGAGLIVGIGPQNTIVLRNGLRRQHLLMMVLLCTLIDGVLITLGTLGMGSLLTDQTLIQVLTCAAAAVLLIYGARSLGAAFSPNLAAQQEASLPTRRQVILALLGVSLLNPSVYMDTLVLIGGSSIRYADDLRMWFAVGAILASLVWFWGLSYGSAMLAPLVKQPKFMRWLDGLSGGILLLMALRLLTHIA
jgi:L-lysine exporter family protein LysE/ArgO